jgi:protoporphyrinogen oxidase
MNSKHPVRIIGAGMSGLVAGINLHKRGVPFVIHEYSSQAGGRLRTESLDGWPMDRGFQVLLTAYPQTQKYLDYKALDLKYFKSGAQVFKDGQSFQIGNPLQDWELAWPTLRYPWARLADKWKLARLTRELGALDLPHLFARKEVTTLQYLKNKGFSEPMINSFFRPFFGGIFLEKELNTSSRMFEFVLKMFSTGRAAVPTHGIQNLATQLARQIPDEHFQWNQEVMETHAKKIRLKDGRSLPARAVLRANSTADHAKKDWNRCYNIYFSSPQTPCIRQPMIGLIADEHACVTNFHYLNAVPGAQRKDEQIISATCVNTMGVFNQQKAINEAANALGRHANLHQLEVRKVFEIDRALPILDEVKLEASDSDIRDEHGVYHCGDILAAPSLNMAIRNGEKAAKCIIEDVQEKA